MSTGLLFSTVGFLPSSPKLHFLASRCHQQWWFWEEGIGGRHALGTPKNGKLAHSKLGSSNEKWECSPWHLCLSHQVRRAHNMVFSGEIWVWVRSRKWKNGRFFEDIVNGSIMNRVRKHQFCIPKTVNKKGTTTVSHFLF